MIPVIKFLHKYVKMPPDVESLDTYIKRIVVTQYSALTPDQIEKDTALVGGGHYELPRDWLIKIELYSDTPGGAFEWATMRRFTEYKFDYYKSLEGKQVIIKIGQV